jgi:two-component system, cell cycle sensor histidine kinase and response regulator CckA
MEGKPEKRASTAASPPKDAGAPAPTWGLCTDQSPQAAKETESRLIKILVLEDNPNDAELMVHELRQLGFEFEWERVDTEAEYLARLSPKLDLILSDYELPTFNGHRALELLKERQELDIPFIIISGTIGEETAVAAIKLGAADYLIKDRIARLGPAVRRALQEVEERQERRRLQAQFIEAQKMEVVGHLAAGVAHDFNNVLAVIMGYSDLIMQDLDASHPLQKYAEEIRHAANRAAGLTQQLLIFSRKETIQPKELDLNEVIGGMEKMLRRLIDENIDMSVVPGTDLGHIRADSGYVWQVLMNMVVNARDAMPNGGRIVLETRNVRLDGAYILAHPGVATGDYVLLSVSDTGIGMSDEVKLHLFEPFFTTKPVGKGTGLGLVTCNTIIRQSGGHIDVSSEIGRGATFQIYFPRVEQPTAITTGASTKTGPLPGGNEVLLIVEDEPSVRHLAQSVLEAQGYRVKTALNGEDALRVAREQKDPPIALVVTDVVMPGMGGKAMAEWLKTLNPSLKILFTSGYSEETVATKGVLQNDVEFLPKPYTPATLARKVRELLDQKTGR